MPNEKGFTLIEIIATLVIMGFITMTAGMGIVHAVQAYVFAKQNAAIAQKTAFAFSRMTVELMNCTQITAATSSQVVFFTTAGNVDGVQRTISVNTNAVTLNSFLLIDNIAAGSSLSYRKFDNTAWTTSNDFSDLAAIDVVLVVKRSGTSAEQYSFNTSITMRNNSVPNAPFPGA
ncbi:prepilin-type N-terminal cleavage/methylation domain-containing protein [uncultured Desulfobacter sp.]|uniref:PilW family protein n=1 Tax=uncultured Desulfobacter sp. TaxID=240139 RepID=UPI002AAAD177|nr:prepilin-type N-terminal cleavage/methylation domain-containing protein [uncultured Desulfobacter sp.]